ncbi:MAG: DMT family transporter [Rhodocyclaceae bacterium]|nr:DMT family transporter [Rhodocyclaceae bacterium]
MSLRRGYLAALIVVCCWSGFNIVSRIGGRSELTPFDIAALRFGVAGLVMSPLFIRVMRDIDHSRLIQYVVVACFGGLGYALLAYTGFSLAPAAHAGVLVNGGIPFATALIAWLALGQRPRGRALLALSIALAGIVMIGLQSFTHIEAGSRQWVGDLCFLAAATAWAIAGLLMRRWQLKPIETTAMMVGLSALVYLPIYVLFLPKHLLLAPLGSVVLQGVYQGLVAATMAGIFYNYANHTIGPHKASLMLALVPGITAVAAVPMLGEALTPLAICGVVLVTFGAVLGATQRS